MPLEIGRNDQCPCGSGLKYKRCCLNKLDLSENLDIQEKAQQYLKKYGKNKKKSRIKRCLHPITSECSKRIINAHSIQNNKIIKRLSDNGDVYMPISKKGIPISNMEKYGRKEASTFFGFCGYHDKILFQPIEDYQFNYSNLHIFLYTFRCLSLEINKKQEVVKSQDLLINDELFSNNNQEQYDLRHGMDLSARDLMHAKKYFDESIINANYDILTSIVWEFNSPSKFSVTGFTVPDKDFEGNKIQDLDNHQLYMNHIFISVFPEGEKTYCILSWLKQNNELFSGIRTKLESLTITEQKNYINNLIPMNCENFIVNPTAWDNWPNHKKEGFLLLFYTSDFLFENDIPEFESPGFDLFEL